MKNISKSHLPFIVSFILLLAVGFAYYNFSPRTDIGPNEAVLTVNFGETKRSFAGEAMEGMTIFDALLVSAEAGDFSFDFDNGKLKGINGFQENDKKWNLYLNEKRVEGSLNKILIEAGDKVELIFE